MQPDSLLSTAQVLRDHPKLSGTGRLTLSQSLRCVRKALWDEGPNKLVSFREMEAAIRPPL